MSLRMIQVCFESPALYEWARQISLTLDDTGYLVHAALRACFGEDGPQPFVVLPGKGRVLHVLGYGRADADSLLETARAVAKPALYRALSSSSRPIDDKLMPETWRSGARYGFRVLACPVRRRRDADGRVAERDVFLSEALAKPKDVHVDREHVYCDWLCSELRRYDGAAMIEAGLKSFRLTQPARKNRKARPAKLDGRRPEALFEGLLEVMDPAGFGELLARGIGRHRAFGYGMLLLHPARS